MPKQTDFFTTNANAKPNHTLAESSGRIEIAAHRLAVNFTEDLDLPTRYRKRPPEISDKTATPRKPKKDSEIDKLFKANVASWRHMIETMLGKLDHLRAWRFIDLVPAVEPGLSRLTDNKDFCAFVDYLILRRDKETCGSDELGCLAALSVAFQREIEKRIPESNQKTD
jgi:hypothetical protein